MKIDNTNPEYVSAVKNACVVLSKYQRELEAKGKATEARYVKGIANELTEKCLEGK